ncbi:MAG: ankyrin repeat domain-containing protein [Armatimonadetes bacterium]|nr:ankyrin repeat domain-containing protein [Armatimonadota bacterium]
MSRCAVSARRLTLLVLCAALSGCGVMRRAKTQLFPPCKTLEQAVRSRWPAEVSRLIQAGADVNKLASDGTPLLIHAIRADSEPIARLLLNAGADPNAKATADYLGENGRPPPPGYEVTEAARREERVALCALEVAIIRKQRATVADLLDAKADLRAMNVRGLTPLHWAAHYARTDIVELLLERGAPVDLLTRFGQSALEIVVSGGYATGNMYCGWEGELLAARDTAALLINHGADLRRPLTNGNTLLIEACQPVSAGAIRRDMAMLLIDKGLDCRATTTEGLTALWYACHSEANQDLLTVVRALLAHGAEPNEGCDRQGMRALHYVCATEARRAARQKAESPEAADLVRALLAAGADPLAKNGEGRTPLAILDPELCPETAKVLGRARPTKPTA